MSFSHPGITAEHTSGSNFKVTVASDVPDDQVRGKDVNKALSILKFSQKQASLRLEKLLLSAINNWQQKNPDSDVENEQLYIKEIKVDGAGMLKRLRPAPQGRAHRIRKRSNHVTMILGNLNQNIN